MGVILQSNEPEKAWNGLRFANACLKRGHPVRVFLMSAGVEAPGLREAPYDAGAQLEAFAAAGGTVLACGTCLKGRGQEGTELCPLSTMNDCVDLVEWAERVVTF
ncbi:MAG TPA: DsrE family protein [Holophaga sp.]|nr:DsrE family protein [Holophaga sp.]